MLACPKCGEPNPERARFCLSCGTPLSGEGTGARAHESRRRVTILFADLVGSTPLGERLDPEVLRTVQARFFDALRVAIERHEGTVEKFIGDEVMAVFGIPRLHEDDALRAVRAAFDMQNALDLLNRGLQPRWGVQLAIRTGIHTGTVVAGDASGEALVTGDVVVTAKRLETAAEPGEMLVGAETYRLVRHAVSAEPIAPVKAKGKAEPLPAWRITAVDATAGAVPRQLDSPMVGRDRELQILAEAAERSRVERAPQLVTILGLAGVGKSRLVHEFLAGVRTDATVIRGHCLPYGEAISYWPVAEALRAAAGIQPDEPPALAVEHLGALAAELPQAEVVIERVAAAIGLAPADDGPARGAQETYWAFRRLFEAMARQRPLIAVFDDVHWATPTFLELLEHIADWSRDARIVLLAIARPELLEVRPTWGGGKLNATALLLEPLDDASVGEMLGNLVGRSLPAELTRRIGETAEGNPFFVEELVAKLVDDGILRLDANGYRMTAAPLHIAVPPTIELLLASRLDRLPSDERAVLERAAVIGKRCGAAEVAELGPVEEQPAVIDRLMALVRKELLRLDEEAAPDIDAIDEDVRFRFRHQLMRDAAYEGISKHERARLHEALAVWMEQKLAERLESLREVIGYHFEQAAAYREEVGGDDEATTRLRERAATHLEAAARRADAIGDAAALRLLERANALRPPEDPQRLANLPPLAAALQFAGRFEEARVARDEVLAAPHAERGTRAAALELNLGWSLGESTGEDWLQVEEALRIRRDLGEPAGIATALLALAGLERLIGRLKHSAELAEEALGYARQAGDLAQEGAALASRSLAFQLGLEADPARAMSMLEEDLAFARTHGLLLMESATLIDMGMTTGQRGALSEARELIARGVGMRRELGQDFHERRFFSDAVLDYWAGDTSLAADRLRSVSRELAAAGENGQLSRVAGWLARSLIDLGELQEAEEALRTAEETGAADNVVAQVQLMAARARLLARVGALADAETMARDAIREAESVEVNQLVPAAHLALGDVLRLAGRLDEAAAEWRGMIAFSEARGNQLYAGRLRRELEHLEQAAPQTAAE
jgi:class 3 adenylate cyclase/tetratricopeptide (TPR) repeat protein